MIIVTLTYFHLSCNWKD